MARLREYIGLSIRAIRSPVCVLCRWFPSTAKVYPPGLAQRERAEVSMFWQVSGHEHECSSSSQEIEVKFMDASKNLQNMKQLDDSWNAQDLATFRRYHTKDCIVRWPNQPPTHGVDAHAQEAIAFSRCFPTSTLSTTHTRSCWRRVNGHARSLISRAP